jgi:hypothetical protein
MFTPPAGLRRALIIRMFSRAPVGFLGDMPGLWARSE